MLCLAVSLFAQSSIPEQPRPTLSTLQLPIHLSRPQKWEAHVRELQAGPSAIRNPAIDAIAAWAGVSWKARAAMKRSTPASVQCIEAPILAFLQQVGVLFWVCRCRGALAGGQAGAAWVGCGAGAGGQVQRRAWGSRPDSTSLLLASNHPHCFFPSRTAGGGGGAGAGWAGGWLPPPHRTRPG